MKKVQIIFITLILILFTAPGLWTLLAPDRQYSEDENRMLQTRPEISASSILTGNTQKELKNYFSDQMPFRDQLMESATEVKKFLGYEDIGGVYIGKENHYFEKKTSRQMEDSKFLSNIDRLSGFLSQYSDDSCSVLLVPSGGTALRSLLPDDCDYYNESEYYDYAKDILGSAFIDIRDAVKNQKQDYYKTDHHWTAYGAYEGYRAYCSHAGLKVRPFDEYDPKAVSDAFYGSLYSKTLDPSTDPDEFMIYQKLPEVQVEINGESTDSIYQISKLKEKDKYAAFFGGNYNIVKITTKAETGRRLLCIKDSFANSMIPYLLYDYDEIIMVDLRYYRSALSPLMDEESITDILVLYETGNFGENTFMTLGGL